MEFRKATEGDLERLSEIHLAAYPDERGDEDRKRNLTHNRFGPFDDLIVAVDDRSGDVIAHAFLFRLRAWFGGVPVKMGGIASVAVAPEARGRGVATALMEQLHVLSDTRGDALTMLYPFRQGYYARFGYATTSSVKRIAVDPRSIPRSWGALARDRVRNARGLDAVGIRNVHARKAARSSGWTTRTKTFWERFFARERRMLLVCGPPPVDASATKASGGPTKKKKTSSSVKARRAPSSGPITGYVAFSIVQDEPHAEQCVEVDELIADDDETRRALLGALSGLRDQVAEITMTLSEDDPLERVLIDSDGHRHGTEQVEHGLGVLVGGPMIRIEDIPRALAARGYKGSGAFDVVVRALDGQHAHTTSQDDVIALGVHVREGRAEIGPARGGGALHTTRAGLAAIMYGGLRVTDAIALGLAEVDHDRVAARIDTVARIDPLSRLDPF